MFSCAGPRVIFVLAVWYRLSMAEPGAHPLIDRVLRQDAPGQNVLCTGRELPVDLRFGRSLPGPDGGAEGHPAS